MRDLGGGVEEFLVVGLGAALSRRCGFRNGEDLCPKLTLVERSRKLAKRSEALVLLLFWYTSFILLQKETQSSCEMQRLKENVMPFTVFRDND